MRAKMPIDPTMPNPQKIRHIHTTVGAVVTFQRGSGCLMCSCA
jgi:hypothetical protein